MWDNLKRNWVKTVYAGTTRKVAGHIVRKSAATVAKKRVSNIVAESVISLVVAAAAWLHSKIVQRLVLARNAD